MTGTVAACMLLHLSIRDFAIVAALDLEFSRGFTVLTGETGAGKSILVDALALALGERADAMQVRAGAERAEVAAEFGIEEAGEIPDWMREQALEGEPGKLLLRRVVDPGGRSRAFVNGHAATLAQMRWVGDWMVDIHGQNAHQSLLRSDAQRSLLDSHAGLTGLAAEVAEAFRAWENLDRARAEYEADAAARDEERERLRWQVQDLSKLGLLPGEWEQIQNEHGRLAHAASLIAGTREALESLSESEASVLRAVAATISRLRPLLTHDSLLSETVSMLESGEAQLQEAVHTLRRYADRVELDPGRLAEVERRMKAIHGTSRKYRLRPEDLPGLMERQRARLQELEAASSLEVLLARERDARGRYEDLARDLSVRRTKAARTLAREVTAAMKELAMANGRFEIALRESPARGSAQGAESVEFLVSANPGTEPGPLAKIASGGELSRISLAIQVVTSRAAAVPTLIFDEVDSGIGGAVAEVVGKKLRDLGEKRQVLCVTHLPQVAACAHQQWSVEKAMENGRVTSRVAALNGKERVEEIARMLGGVEITATTRRHAAEMLGLR